MNRFDIISLEKAKELANRQGYILVDMRSRYDYDMGHIENAINIPEANLSKINTFNRKEYTWILYCKRGGLSFKLAGDMAREGYKVLAVAGGFR